MSALPRVLSDAEIAKIAEIHEQSLAVPARTGMRIDSDRARRILEAAAARVDHAARRVRFPRERRAPTRQDWWSAATLVDTMDDVVMYWQMVTVGDEGPDPARPVLDEARAKAFAAINGHQQLPFEDGVDEALDQLASDAEAVTTAA